MWRIKKLDHFQHEKTREIRTEGKVNSQVVAQLDTTKDFLCELGIKPHMLVVETIIFSLYSVTIGPTNIIKEILNNVENQLSAV